MPGLLEAGNDTRRLQQQLLSPGLPHPGRALHLVPISLKSEELGEGCVVWEVHRGCNLRSFIAEQLSAEPKFT